MAESIEKLLCNFEGLQIKIDETRIKVSKNPAIIMDILRNESDDWSSADYDQPFTLIDLETTDSQYSDIRRRFKASLLTRRILKIEKVLNPFTYAHYLLRKWQYCKQDGSNTVVLFHGTKEINIIPICEVNFNWRFVGRSGFLGGKYGDGVSFSPSASYASMFPRRHHEDPRVMFVVKAMENNFCVGYTGMIIPPESIDTTMERRGKVHVKYYDNEFYPQYIIYYK